MVPIFVFIKKGKKSRLEKELDECEWNDEEPNADKLRWRFVTAVFCANLAVLDVDVEFLCSRRHRFANVGLSTVELTAAE